MTKNLKYVFMVRIVSLFTKYESLLAAMIHIKRQVLMFRHLCLILAIGVSCLHDRMHCLYRVIFYVPIVDYF